MNETDQNPTISGPSSAGSRCTFRFLVGFVLIATGSICRASALQWEKQSISLAATRDETDLRIQFPFTNRGKADVTIASVEPSCGCVVAAASKSTFAPGERGTVTALFEVGDNIGRHKVSITVITREPQPDSIRLELDVTVPAALDVEPRSIVWSLGSAASDKTMLCTALPGHSLTLLSVLSSDPTIVAWIEVLAVHQRYRLHVKPMSTDRCCHSVLRLRLETDSVEARSFDAFADVKNVASGASRHPF